MINKALADGASKVIIRYIHANDSFYKRKTWSYYHYAV